MADEAGMWNEGLIFHPLFPAFSSDIHLLVSLFLALHNYSLNSIAQAAAIVCEQFPATRVDTRDVQGTLPDGRYSFNARDTNLLTITSQFSHKYSLKFCC